MNSADMSVASKIVETGTWVLAMANATSNVSTATIFGLMICLTRVIAKGGWISQAQRTFAKESATKILRSFLLKHVLCTVLVQLT